MWLYEVLRNEQDYTLTQVGLAVDDVKELQKQANRHRMKLMVSITSAYSNTIPLVVNFLVNVYTASCCIIIPLRKFLLYADSAVYRSGGNA